MPIEVRNESRYLEENKQILRQDDEERQKQLLIKRIALSYLAVLSSFILLSQKPALLFSAGIFCYNIFDIQNYNNKVSSKQSNKTLSKQPNKASERKDNWSMAMMFWIFATAATSMRQDKESSSSKKKD